jgi:hypothetical protein
MIGAAGSHDEMVSPFFRFLAVFAKCELLA